MRQFWRYFWGTIVRPRHTLDALGAERSVRWAVMAACLPVLQVWGNVALHAVFGLDWLGTRQILKDPTFVAGFGQWQVGLRHWVAIFAALMPFLSALDMVVISGFAHLLSKLWGGRGTFEQMVNSLTFASVVPNMVIAGISEWLFSVPLDLATGHPYWWTAAMQGELGPVVGVVWNVYVFGVYLGAQWAWTLALGAMAIRRLQRVPTWAAVSIMVLSFAASMFLSSVFVR